MRTQHACRFLSREQSAGGSNPRLSDTPLVRERRPTASSITGLRVTNHPISLTAKYDLFVGGSGSTMDLDWLSRTARPILTAHQVLY